MKEQNKNEDLMDAVSCFNVKAVKNCLEDSADPNYKRIYREEYSACIQPDTPLRLVMFRISDCMLEDSDLRKFAEIAEILLSYGADPKPAMQIAESRYGKYDPDFEQSPFADVWHIIANWK